MTPAHFSAAGCGRDSYDLALATAPMRQVRAVATAVGKLPSLGAFAHRPGGIQRCRKSTLLRLIAGRLALTSGHITTNGNVGYLPQMLTLVTDSTVADLDRKVGEIGGGEAMLVVITGLRLQS
ncbi:hypothetical protein J2Y41_000945 [Arthrobacter sp. 1088]|uniref:hypothetical protein n=1 Tax=Arthrobacter sp. 1088 TaxID=2817768 RepID=UPI00285B951A|nr:hypothetical protein [Arthrobacter sp. 1088]